MNIDYGFNDLSDKDLMEPEEQHECGRCHTTKGVEERYSYGIYAGRYCAKCAYERYNDHCGLKKLPNGQYVDEGEQGDPTQLDEFAYGGYDAIDATDEEI